MNLAMIFYVLGFICLCDGALMLAPMVVAAIYGEPVMPFLVAIGISVLLGGAMLIHRPRSRVFGLREGFVITSVGWLLLSLLGAIPFVVSGAIPNYIDAFFETVSGFTTTGASILTAIEGLPYGILFWRSFTHWIGGMGVLVFILTIMPKEGGSYANLMKAESPGPQVEKLVPKLRYTAMILYGIYLGLTVLEAVILVLFKMPLFDAITITFGTAGTGGFAIKNDSLASYTIAQQNVVTIFMILFGVNFNFYFFLLLRKFSKAFSMEEVRWYLGIILASILAISFNIMNSVGGFLTAFQQAAFQVGSIITTTGFATVDFDLWPHFSRTILVTLMFIGACAGSTGGGLKVGRVLMLVKDIRRQYRKVLSPRRVSVTRIDGKVVPKDTLNTANSYLTAYVLIFAASVLVLSLDGYDTTTNFTAVAATLNNIGPGLALVGPSANYSIFSWWGKLLLSADMLAGRLELFPVMVLISPTTWRGR